MKVRFWGTRGSLAKPGPRTVRYGGNTSCVSVETASGILLVIDCGTGVHDLGQHLLAHRRGPIHGHVLISHTHWDHIQGIPFFAPLFAAGHQWDFYAAQGFGESLRETLAGQMEYTYFPVTPDAFNASVHYHHLGEGSFRIGDALIRTRYLNHPALTLAFRIEVDGAVLVYACDHEPHDAEAARGGTLRGEDLEHVAFLRDADLVIHDAQYCAEEYPNKVGWGHSTVEYATRACADAGARRLALTHHDPLRHDEAVDVLLSNLLGAGGPARGDLEVFAAAEGMEIELFGAAASCEDGPSALQAERPVKPGAIVSIGRSDAFHDEVRAIVQDDGVEVHPLGAGQDLIATLGSLRPGLLLLDAEIGSEALQAAARRVQQSDDPRLGQLPVVVFGRAAPADQRDWSAVAGWLARPCSREYARSRLRAFLLRARCRWQAAAAPRDEAARLAALHALRLLDTPREERFDRYTRMASAMFGTPFALISLVDADRQWFKSCIGIDASESSRDVSFCAHAIHQRELFIVPDTLLDDRFAENPMVVDGPRVRFYAGCPLVLASGHCIGTLCLVDQRPRELSVEQARLLQDLGALVLQEIEAGVPAG